MRERGGSTRLWLLALALCAGLALMVPAGAGAATVVNGNFETGNLQGWQVVTPDHEFGDWFAYQGTTPPFSRNATTKRGTVAVPAPPQGEWAAIADELNPITVILYQDIVLAPGLKHQLSLQTFYSSNKPLAAPTPDSLSPEESVIGSQANQQYRIDVMRPEAPLESIDPADILRTVFHTAPGGPLKMPPTRMTANLTPFAGQTVRLRVAVVAGKEALNAGIDDVSVTSTAAGSEGGAGSGGGKGGKGGQGGGATLRVVSAKSLAGGRALLRVHVPGAGRLTAKCPKRLVPASAQAGRAKTVSLRLRATVKAMHALERKGSLHLRVALAFKPRGEATQRATAPVTLKLAPGRQRR